MHRAGDHVIIQTFLIKNHIRFDPAAAGADRNRVPAVPDIFRREEFAALCAVVPVNTAVKLINFFAAGGLVQAVDVLGDNGKQFSFLFPLGQFQVSFVGLRFQGKHFIPVKAEEFFRLLHEEGVGQDGFRRIIVFLIVKTVHAAEVRDAAFRGDTGAAEEDDTGAFINILLEKLIRHGTCLPIKNSEFIL